MEIGSVIREKRTAQGLTQEQVATALGVSAPAVSKWERGESFPEITLLPALARLLGTDLNGLLSFQQEMGREEIAAFLGRLVQVAEEGPQAAFALARAQVGQFPRCDSLALNVALTLEGVLTMAGREGSAEEREWIQALYRQAAESRDQAVACQAQAKGDGDRAGQLLEHQLLQQASGAQTTLLALLELAGREGRRGDLAPLADKAVALGQLLELAPYGGWSVRLQQACLTRDTDAALAALAGLLGSLETPWPGTSPLCRHLPRKDGAVLGARLRPGILRELADPDNPTYAFLRSDPRFWDLVGEAPAAP